MQIQNVHFLIYYVRVGSDRASEEICLFENRRADIAEAVSFEDLAGSLFDVVPQGAIGRKDIAGAFNGAKLALFGHATPWGVKWFKSLPTPPSNLQILRRRPAQFWFKLLASDECRLECTPAMQLKGLDTILIGRVSIRKSFFSGRPCGLTRPGRYASRIDNDRPGILLKLDRRLYIFPFLRRAKTRHRYIRIDEEQISIRFGVKIRSTRP